ncbi:MAG TPA: ABC transporter ATP-binding protein, partial [Myxococcales bacterium]|nr:ABC transporter ATP-binding protein [Myxococcales bacterium]
PGQEAEFVLKNNYFAHLMSKQPPFYRRIEVGDLMSRGSNDIQFIRVLVGYAGLQILNLAFALPLNLTMMMDISVSLTLGCVLPLVVAGFVMRYAVFRMMSRYLAAQQELSSLSDQILESYNGIAAVRSYHAQTAFQTRFDRRNEKYVNTQIEIAFVRSWLMPLVHVVGNLAILILLYWGGTKVVDGSLHFGAVSAFAVYVGNVVAALFSLSWVLNVIQRGSISLVRVMEVLDDPPQVPEVTDSLPSGALSIEARALTFCYPDTGRKAALEGLSFSVAAGATLGIFGTTGSGKTTLIRLLTRLETPPVGTLFVGGRDVVTLLCRKIPICLGVVWLKIFNWRCLTRNSQMNVSPRCCVARVCSTSLKCFRTGPILLSANGALL